MALVLSATPPPILEGSALDTLPAGITGAAATATPAPSIAEVEPEALKRALKTLDELLRSARQSMDSSAMKLPNLAPEPELSEGFLTKLFKLIDQIMQSIFPKGSTPLNPDTIQWIGWGALLIVATALLVLLAWLIDRALRSERLKLPQGAPESTVIVSKDARLLEEYRRALELRQFAKALRLRWRIALLTRGSPASLTPAELLQRSAASARIDAAMFAGRLIDRRAFDTAEAELRDVTEAKPHAGERG